MLRTRVAAQPASQTTLEPPELERALGARVSTRSMQSFASGSTASAELLDVPTFAGRTVLLATDGSPASAAATHVAYALAREHRAIVHAVSVMDSRRTPSSMPLDLALSQSDAAPGTPARSRQLHLMRDALSATVGQPIDWPVRVMLGSPADAIAQEARRIHATLIVMGLRRHGVLDRGVHDETTLGVVRRAHCPVLAVTVPMQGLPTRVLAALDFGPVSETAARRAGALLAAGGSMVLAYVPALSAERVEAGELLIRELGIEAAFSQCESELPERGARIDRAVLHHKLPHSTAKLLLEYAVSTNADLVAAGSMRQRRVDRWLLGSVTTELVRDGRRSVLIVPPVEEPEDGWMRL
jgi:nucleotide-binding universal stress UspA family protein